MNKILTMSVHIDNEITFTGNKISLIEKRVGTLRYLQQRVASVGPTEPEVVERLTVNTIETLGAEGLYRAVTVHFGVDPSFSVNGEPIYRSRIKYGGDKPCHDVVSDGSYHIEASLDLGRVRVMKSRDGLLGRPDDPVPTGYRTGNYETDKMVIEISDGEIKKINLTHNSGLNIFSSPAEQIGAFSMAEAACKLALRPYGYPFVSMFGIKGPVLMEDGSMEIVNEGRWVPIRQ